jgi:hypothetical protein
MFDHNYLRMFRGGGGGQGGLIFENETILVLFLGENKNIYFIIAKLSISKPAALIMNYFSH